ncbi:hypothetical protein CSOJ01_06348 [Colletotrichum sojae]|uniref:Uncharacterized protein n=1 Tax=Colletotrichum sojae TaxID=2175907 RepID=A0A8H6MVE4_9PEZI|nr:hypothetical protein CSOJ01_06348 [Colletotrichum sojae]
MPGDASKNSGLHIMLSAMAGPTTCWNLGTLAQPDKISRSRSILARISHAVTPKDAKSQTNQVVIADGGSVDLKRPRAVIPPPAIALFPAPMPIAGHRGYRDRGKYRRVIMAGKPADDAHSPRFSKFSTVRPAAQLPDHQRTPHKRGHFASPMRLAVVITAHVNWREPTEPRETPRWRSSPPWGRPAIGAQRRGTCSCVLGAAK